jgi:thiol-disulfide isomerase/thioredoxin
MAQEVEIIGFGELQKVTETPPQRIIHFWATWCKPCLEELTLFETFNEKLRQSNIEVILVSLDFPEDVQKVNEFIESKSITARFFLLNEPDYNSWIDKVDPSWSGALPATLMLIDQNKTFIEGKIESKHLENALKK